MKITDRDIDNGKPFDWGKTSLDYAKFRDIYPEGVINFVSLNFMPWWIFTHPKYPESQYL